MSLSKITNGMVAPSAIPSGGIIQVKQAVKTDRQDILTSGSTASDITGLSVAITPTSTSNKIYCLVHLNCGYYTNYNGMSSFLFRDSTKLYFADADGNRNRGTNSTGRAFHNKHMTAEMISFLDSPSTTSEVTYSVKMEDVNADGGGVMINGDSERGNTSSNTLGVSSITVMEVAG